MTVSDKKYHGMAVFQPVINGKMVVILCTPTAYTFSYKCKDFCRYSLLV